MAPKTRSASKKQSGEAEDDLKEIKSATPAAKGGKRKQKVDTSGKDTHEVKGTGRKRKEKVDIQDEPVESSAEVIKAKPGRKRKTKAAEGDAKPESREEEPEMEEEGTSPKKTKGDSQEELTAVQEPSPMETTETDKQQSVDNESGSGKDKGDNGAPEDITPLVQGGDGKNKGDNGAPRDIPLVQGGSGDSGGSGKDEGDDETPEDIPLGRGKEEALEQLKDEVLQAQRVQQEARERRRRKNEQFKSQKETKRLKQLSRFPNEALKEIARMTAKEKETKQKQAAKLRKEKKSGSKADIPNEVHDERLSVVALSETPDQLPPSYEGACDFLKQHLYGSRHRRIPMLSFAARRYTNQPAKNF